MAYGRDYFKGSATSIDSVALFLGLFLFLCAAMRMLMLTVRGFMLAKRGLMLPLRITCM